MAIKGKIPFAQVVSMLVPKALVYSSSIWGEANTIPQVPFLLVSLELDASLPVLYCLLFSL